MLMELEQEQSATQGVSNVETDLDEIESNELRNEGLKEYKNKSKLFHTNPQIAAFVKQVTKEINLLPESKWKTSQISKTQNKLIKQLQEEKDIIIKMVDKGGNIVVMSTKQYEQMCTKVLQNCDWYQFTTPGTIKRAGEELKRIV